RSLQAYLGGRARIGDVFVAGSLRVYYQGTDGNLHQHCRDDRNARYAGSALPLPSGTRPYSGTALATVSKNPSSAEISLFFQGNDGYVYQAKYNGSWTV